MKRWPATILALLLAAGCTSEASRVRDARNQFYEASARFDAPGIRAAVTPDWLAVDHDRILNVDSLVAGFEMLQTESLQVRYTFADSTIRVNPPLAWMVYRGRKIIRRPGAADTSFSIETAAFRRDGSGWKLTLLHRSPILAAAAYFGGAPSPTLPAGAPPETAASGARAARPPARPAASAPASPGR